MQLFTDKELLSRIRALQKVLSDNTIDAAVFNQTPELFYYSGSVLPLYCIVPAKGTPFLLARKGAGRIQEECSHMPLELFGNSKELAAILQKYSMAGIKRAGFVLDASSYTSVVRMATLFGQAVIADISGDVRMLRTVKSEAEIAIQTRAAGIIAHLPEVVRSSFHSGITELEMSAHIEFYLRARGAGTLKSKQEGLVLSPGVFSAGMNSLAPHKFDGICSGAGLSPALPFGGSNQRIPENTAVICDYGFLLDGYHVDMTRMFSIGNPPQEALRALDAMLAIEELVMDALKPGASWESVWIAAEKAARELGYEEQFMGLGTEKVKFVGHGLGLYLDEPPYLAPKMTDTIGENMVIAVEPKVALPGIGVVGIEDTVLVSGKGVVCLTTCPKEFYIL